MVPGRHVHTPSRDWKLLGLLSQSCPPTWTLPPHPAVPPIGSHTFARAHLGMIEKSASRDREILQRELSALHHRTNCCTLPLERKKHHNGKLGFAGIAERTRRRETISCPFAGILSAFSWQLNTNEHLLCYRAKIHSIHLGINLQAFSLKHGSQKDLKIEFFCLKPYIRDSSFSRVRCKVVFFSV